MSKIKLITEWSQLPVVLDVVMTCRVLGVSESTVLNLIKSDKLPAFRVGKLWRISRDDLLAYLNDNKKGGRLCSLL